MESKTKTAGQSAATTTSTAKGASNKEKRKHKRHYDRMLVQLHGKDFLIYTNATNICAGGAFINTLYLLNEGTFLTLKMQVPDSPETIDVRGKVIRQVADNPDIPTMDEVGMAIQFTDLTDELEESIHAIIQTN